MTVTIFTKNKTMKNKKAHFYDLREAVTKRRLEYYQNSVGFQISAATAAILSFIYAYAGYILYSTK